jgi:hypothetical protein
MNVLRLNPDVEWGLVVSFIKVSAAGEKRRSPRRLTALTTTTGLGSGLIGRERSCADISGQLSLMERGVKCERRARYELQAR